MENYLKAISDFFVVGINYKKSDAAIRGRFSVNCEQYEAILHAAQAQGIGELFVLSTCNRTEIYGFAQNSRQLVELLCEQTAGNTDTFLASAYIKNGRQAVEHLFAVGAGLDSQILGDYEIIGQIKTSAKFAKERGFIAAFMERLINHVLQASKIIKNTTALSGGTVSVSFAAVQYLANMVVSPADKKILLIGTGKIGRNTCRNLVDYLDTKNITVMNRSFDKAEQLSKELQLRVAPMEDLAREVSAADIILISTNSCTPIIYPHHLQAGKPKLIIDLSVPCNVAADARSLENVQVIDVDRLSQIKDETLKMRTAEVPKARAVINDLLDEFEGWCNMRRHVPMLKDLKIKLKELHAHPLYVQTSTCPKTLEVKIQRVLNDTAGKVKLQNQRGCQYLAALNDFINAKN